MRGGKSAQRALLLLLLSSLVVVAMVLRPLGKALFLAAVLSMVLIPLHQRLTRGLRGHARLSAGALVVGVLLLILGPLVGLVAFLVNEGIQAGQFIVGVLRSEGTVGLLERLPEPMESVTRRLLEALPGTETLASRLQAGAAGAGGTAAAAVGSAVSATGSLVFQTVMMLLALFFFLVQKDALIHWVDDASPLREGQTRELIAEFRKVCRAVILSAVVTALVQAVAALVGYVIADVPYPAFFAAVTFFIAFIPAVGAASVVLVTALLMLLTGHPISALFLAAWGLLVVGLVDNIVKPLLIKSGMQMHGALVFFALLGGLSAFGAIGLLIGPLSVAFFLALLRIYQRDYAADPRDREAMRQQGAGQKEGAPRPQVEGPPPLHS